MREGITELQNFKSTHYTQLNNEKKIWVIAAQGVPLMVTDVPSLQHVLHKATLYPYFDYS